MTRWDWISVSSCFTRVGIQTESQIDTTFNAITTPLKRTSTDSRAARQLINPIIIFSQLDETSFL